MPTMECTMVKHNGKFFAVALDRHWRTLSRQPPKCPLSGLRELRAIDHPWRKADQSLSARPLPGHASLATRLHPLPNLIDQCMQRIIPKVRIAFGGPHLSMT